MVGDSVRTAPINAFAAFLLSAASWPHRPVSLHLSSDVARSRNTVLQLAAPQVKEDALGSSSRARRASEHQRAPRIPAPSPDPPERPTQDEVSAVLLKNPKYMVRKLQDNIIPTTTTAKPPQRSARPDPARSRFDQSSAARPQRNTQMDPIRSRFARPDPASRGQPQRFTRPDPAGSRFNRGDRPQRFTRPDPGGSRFGSRSSRPDPANSRFSRQSPSSSGPRKRAPSDDDGIPPPKPTVDFIDDSEPDRKLPKERKKRSFAWNKPQEEEGPRMKGGRGRRKELAKSDDLSSIRSFRAKKRLKREAKAEALEASLGDVRVTIPEEGITVANLAGALRKSPTEIIKALLRRGMLVSMTQTVEADIAEEIALEYDAEVSRGDEDEETEDSDEDNLDDKDALVPRPPVVTIMGHVDHGKTTLLDAMRNASANVADGEAGGITQSIGAYSVTAPDGERITFVDTPGHAAFNAMRERGADTTDIVILVLAADDGVRPQTIESIRAAKAANKPIIVAVTKADKPGANPEKAKLGLLNVNVTLEDLGGDVLSSIVSGKTGEGIDELFNQIALQAEFLELKANPDCEASGTVMEASQTKMGISATVLVQRGTLKVGDTMVAGSEFGTIRAMMDETGTNLDSATPSMAIEVVGLGGLPLAGDNFKVMDSKKEAQDLAESRSKLKLVQQKARKLKEDDGIPIKTLDFLVKADNQGAAEAVAESIRELEVADDLLRVQTRVLSFSAGKLKKTDVKMAGVSDGTIIIFGDEKVPADVQRLANDEQVEIKQYRIIYDMIDDMKAKMASLIRPPPDKELGDLIGTLEILQLFKVATYGKVAGCKVQEGSVRVGSNIRIVRGIKVLYSGKLQTLRSVKDEVEEVEAPNECGITLTDFQLMEPGDRVEVYADASLELD